MTATRTLSTLLGHEITVFTPDHVGDKIAAHGLYEKENLLLLLALLHRLHEPVVLDIGANVGNHSLAFATAAAQVHAFEPLPRLYRVLADNVARNHLHHVTAHHCALSDVEGSDTLYMTLDGNLGASSFDRRSDQVEAVAVNKHVGDDYLRSIGVQKVDLVKIDVEAHELFVLRGLRATLARDLPVLTMEWNDPLSLERLRGSEELAFLQDHYEIRVLGSNYDRGYWQGRPLSFLRRKLTRLLRPRRAVLYPFDSTQLYKNLLLIPKHRAALLDALE
ncbi:MAG TPA: FkbM family methyltransferase [Hyphomicrobiales bacterium]|nr:FkbM family methyltransferase [Hyphomicrobiales bacterium]